MLFTSLTYLVFLATAFVVYWLLPRMARQWFLIAASYLFYASWRVEYVPLLFGLSLFNWAYARWVTARFEATWPLVLGVLANLGVLVHYKYTAFFVENLAAALHGLGLAVSWEPSIPIFLPLGISFFTFQGIAYQVDVASGDKPLTRLGDFLFFKAFWPQLVAGPIIRLHEMEPQIKAPRQLDWLQVGQGCRRILRGAFMKLVIADHLGQHVDRLYASGVTLSAGDAWFAALAFGVQIYCDFSGYSEIAIGSAQLFGYVFPENFNWPYSALSPQEFWNRWHMTLSSWIRDYVFMPLSFASRNRPQWGPLWLIIAMTLCGFWHGAQWTFVLWGAWHGVCLALQRTWLRTFFAPLKSGAPASAHVRVIAGWLVTLVAMNLAWIFFRAHSLEQAFDLLTAAVTLRGGLVPLVASGKVFAIVVVFLLGQRLMPVLAAAWTARVGSERSARWREYAAPVCDMAMLHGIVVLALPASPFVYFQF